MTSWDGVDRRKESSISEDLAEIKTVLRSHLEKEEAFQVETRKLLLRHDEFLFGTDIRAGLRQRLDTVETELNDLWCEFRRHERRWLGDGTRENPGMYHLINTMSQRFDEFLDLEKSIRHRFLTILLVVVLSFVLSHVPLEKLLP